MAQVMTIWEVEVSKFNYADDTKVLGVHEGFYTSRKKAVDNVKMLADLYNGKDINWEYIAKDYIKCDFTDKEGNYRIYTIKSELVF